MLNHTPDPNPEPPKSITLYKYMPWEIAEKVLTNWDLKLTLPHHTNDPFELMPAKGVEYPWGDQSERCCRFGFICFSKINTSAALWGHYGDSHRGVCLAFTFPLLPGLVLSDNGEVLQALIHLFPMDFGSTLFKVSYTQDRFNQQYDRSVSEYIAEQHIADTSQIDGLGKLFSTKDESWSFEQEYRIICSIDAASSFRNGMVFMDQPMDFLSGIYLGIKCPHNTAFVTSMLASITRAKKQELTIEDEVTEEKPLKVIGITQMKCHDTLFQVIPDTTNNYGLLIADSGLQPWEQRYASKLSEYTNKRICLPDRLYTYTPS